MRKLIQLMMISLDGYYEGPGEGLAAIDWHHVDEEWDTYSIEVMGRISTYLFGRKTYEVFASFWPKQTGDIARMLNETEKVVVSHTLTEPTWEHSRLLKGDLAEGVHRLKAQPGGDIALFGNGKLGQELTRLGLIDEYRIGINPVTLGQGLPYFVAGEPRREYRLTDTKVFRTGLILATYAPA